MQPKIDPIVCKEKNDKMYFIKQIASGYLHDAGNDIEKAKGLVYSNIFDQDEGLDENTHEVLEYNKRSFLHYIQCKHTTPDQPKFILQQMKEGKPRRIAMQSKYPGLPWYSNEVFYVDNGLAIVPQSVRDYIRKRDILDVGAFQGDSVIILQN